MDEAANACINLVHLVHLVYAKYQLTWPVPETGADEAVDEAADQNIRLVYLVRSR